LVEVQSEEKSKKKNIEDEALFLGFDKGFKIWTLEAFDKLLDLEKNYSCLKF